MIEDYNLYKLEGSEKMKFFCIGYGAMAGLGYLFYKSIIIAISAGFLILLLRKQYEADKASKRKQLLVRQFRDLLYSISASFATGRNMKQSLGEGLEYLRTIYDDDTPLISELGIINNRIDVNREDEGELISNMASRSHCTDIANFAQVYLICRSTGGDMQTVIQRAFSIISDKMEIETEIKSLTAQKKTEGRIISMMPLVVIAGLNLMAPDYIGILYTTWIGRLIMSVALAGIIVASIIIERISVIEV